MKFVFVVVAAVGLGGSLALAQSTADPASGLADPYQAAVRNWAVLPDQRTWGSTAGIEIGPHNEIWAIDRCGVNSCEGSDLPPVHLLDLTTGKPIKSIGAGLFVFPHGLHVDRDGNVWVVDAMASKDGTKGNQVIKLSSDGKVLLRLGTAGVAGGGPDHFNEPSDVVTASNGDIFVADGHSGQNPNAPSDYITRIVKFSKDGKFIKEWGKLGSGPGEFRNAHALAIDSRNRLFVCDRGNARLQIFDLNGKFLAEWSQFGRPSGLYIDKADKLYVIDADSTAKNHPGWKKGIRIGSAKDGKVTAFVPGHQTDSPDGAAGEGIVADPSGNLYAAENTLRGVTKYAKR
ncbi:MAG: peptidyl-alpha-hydroxyglycine alpha-amidating lyase family protein [Acidobacteriota bacterium]